MFERFTERARRAVVLAQEEASRLRHDHIGTEHLLLGVLAEEKGLAARVLVSMGVSLDAARDLVSESVRPGEEAPRGQVPFTDRAKTVLELSLREAIALGHDYIGTEHVLLGLIREGEGVAARVLTRLGADLDDTRRAVVALLAGHAPVAGGEGPAGPQVVIDSLTAENRRLREEVDRLRAALAALDPSAPTPPG